MRANSVINATTGSRIINLHSLQVHLQEVTDHVATCEACTDERLKNEQTTILFQEANRAGLTSVLISRCAGCQQEFRFSTSPKVKGVTGGKQWETNLAAVWGQMATGGGHKPFAEMMAILGVPTMTKK